MNAQEISLQLTTGQELSGSFVENTDTTITIILDNSTRPLVFSAINIESGTLSDKYIIVRDGKIIFLSKKELRAEKKQQEKVLAQNPNYVIGKALKSTGGLALGIGVPSLLVGSILMAYGNVGRVDFPKNSEENERNKTKDKCAAAGYVLLPVGATLTIIGIPLYVHGKRIAELNINYTGNGAGLALNF